MRTDARHPVALHEEDIIWAALVEGVTDLKRLREAGVAFDRKGNVAAWPKRRVAGYSKGEAHELAMSIRFSLPFFVRATEAEGVINPQAAVERLGFEMAV